MTDFRPGDRVSVQATVTKVRRTSSGYDDNHSYDVVDIEVDGHGLPLKVYAHRLALLKRKPIEVGDEITYEQAKTLPDHSAVVDADPALAHPRVRVVINGELWRHNELSPKDVIKGADTLDVYRVVHLGPSES